MGRPTKFTKKVTDEVIKRLGLGEGLIRICRDDHMPHRQTVLNWKNAGAEKGASAALKGFFDRYNAARIDGLDYFRDEMLDIADDGSNDYITKEVNGKEIEVFDQEHATRSKLRVSTRQWLMSKLAPSKYGERITQHQTTEESPESTESLTDAELLRIGEKATDRNRATNGRGGAILRNGADRT